MKSLMPSQRMDCLLFACFRPIHLNGTLERPGKPSKLVELLQEQACMS
jgi:hypothetical protein